MGVPVLSVIAAVGLSGTKGVASLREEMMATDSVLRLDIFLLESLLLLLMLPTLFCDSASAGNYPQSPPLITRAVCLFNYVESTLKSSVCFVIVNDGETL